MAKIKLILKASLIIAFTSTLYLLTNKISICLFCVALMIAIGHDSYYKGIDNEKEEHLLDADMQMDKNEIIKVYNTVTKEFVDTKAKDIKKGDFCLVTDRARGQMGVLAKSNAIETNLGKIKVIIVF